MTISTSPGTGIRASTGSLGRRALRKNLEVINGGPGPLRHARHRRGLRKVAGMLGQIDDPVRQDAAAFAAHRQDGDRDRLGILLHLRRNARQAAIDPALERSDHCFPDAILETLPCAGIRDDRRRDKTTDTAPPRAPLRRTRHSRRNCRAPSQPDLCAADRDSA